MDWLTWLASGLYALLQWRFMASVGVSIAGALLLSRGLAWFTAGWCVSLVVMGGVAGLLWQVSSDDVVRPKWVASAERLSWPVEALALTFVGLVFGAFLVGAFHSLAAAALGPVAVLAMAGLWTGCVSRRAMALREVVFYAAWPLVGCTLLLIGELALR